MCVCGVGGEKREIERERIKKNEREVERETFRNREKTETRSKK